jgi:hypothetical protein
MRIVKAIPDEPSSRSAPQRMQWSICVRARDVFAACRALLACDGVEIQRCTTVFKLGEARMRVDFSLPADCMDQVLRHAVSKVSDAELGRTRLLGDA